MRCDTDATSLTHVSPAISFSWPRVYEPLLVQEEDWPGRRCRMATAPGANISLSSMSRRLWVGVLTLIDPCELGWGLAIFPYATGVPPSCPRRTTAVPGAVSNSTREIREMEI